MQASLEDNEFKQVFLEGELAIDCLEIKLTQNGVENPRHYKLVGSLFVTPDNGVEARLVWKRDADHPYNQLASLDAMLQIKSGDIFPEDHYFSLIAIDTSGRVWTNPAVFLKGEELMQAEVLTISCEFIQVELDTRDKRTLVHFVFHDELGIRMNSMHSSTEPLRNTRRQMSRRTAAKGVIDEFEVDYYSVDADKSGKAHELSAVAKPKCSPPPQKFRCPYIGGHSVFRGQASLAHHAGSDSRGKTDHYAFKVQALQQRPCSGSCA